MRRAVAGIFLIGSLFTGAAADTLATSSVVQQLYTTLAFEYGTITVTTNAHLTRLIINNIDLGTTPFSNNKFLPGFYHIELLHNDYRPYRKTVLLEKRGTITLNVTLEMVNQNPDLRDTVSTLPLLAADTLADSSGNAVESAQIPVITPIFSALSLTANVEAADVFINKVKAGKSPCFKDSLQHGFYEIEMKKEGYLPYRNIVQLTGSDTVDVHGKLVAQLSWLKITSTPSQAALFINSRRVGTTPFDSSTILPGKYTFRLELDNYVTVNDSILLKKNVTDSIHIPLVAQIVQDSINRELKKSAQMTRRIIFGTLTTASVAGIIVQNSKAFSRLEAEKIAWKQYQEPNLAAEEYDKRFDAYEIAAKKTDAAMDNRKLFYVISALSASLFTFSIRF